MSTMMSFHDDDDDDEDDFSLSTRKRTMMRTMTSFHRRCRPQRTHTHLKKKIKKINIIEKKKERQNKIHFRKQNGGNDDLLSATFIDVKPFSATSSTHRRRLLNDVAVAAASDYQQVWRCVHAGWPSALFIGIGRRLCPTKSHFSFGSDVVRFFVCG